MSESEIKSLARAIAANKVRKGIIQPDAKQAETERQIALIASRENRCIEVQR